DLSNDDVDHDGLPDWWEQMHFANLTTAGKDTDFDGDGATDRQEFLVGTDPKDSNSVFKLLSARRTGPTDISIRWSGVVGQIYALERTTNIAAGFTEIVEDDIEATARINMTTDTNAAGPGPFFYRVRLKN